MEVDKVQNTDTELNEDITYLLDYPYFVLSNKVNGTVFRKEVLEIEKYYKTYKKGARFFTEGSAGDYVPSQVRFKNIKTLINKEARFMFSQAPDIHIQGITVEDAEKEQVEQLQTLVDKVLERNHFQKLLLQSAKDCFIGKRIACLVDFSEESGVLLHFYNSKQFYYEKEYGSEKIVRFVGFENIEEGENNNRKYLINDYRLENGVVYMSLILYDKSGNVLQTVISDTATELDRIPVSIIFNTGTLDDKRGVSEVSDLWDEEALYSKISNGDVDSVRKGMNPIRYVVDMNSQTTKNLSSGAGAFWDLKSEQNQNEVHPLVGTLAPALNHTEPTKAILERIKSDMYGQLEIPNISEETMVGTITSGKALKALYYPLQVRCDEKMITWKPCLIDIVKNIIDIALLNVDIVKGIYPLVDLHEIQYNVIIQEHYALAEDEQEEKATDLSEIASNTRSRKSYMKKWRPELTDEQINEELLQIATELNMFDTMSVNTQVQTELDNVSTQYEVDKNTEDIETEQKAEKQTVTTEQDNKSDVEEI